MSFSPSTRFAVRYIRRTSRFRINRPVEQVRDGLYNYLRGGRIVLQIGSPMGVLGYSPAIMVPSHRPSVFCAAFRVPQVVRIVTDRESELVGHQSLANQIHGQLIRHLPDHHPGFIKWIGLLQHLTRPYAFGGRLIGFDMIDRARFPAPRVVNQSLSIDTEHFI